MTGPRRLAEGWSHRAVGKGPRCFPRQGGSEKIAAWSGERSESPVDRPGRTAHTRTPGRRFPAASSPASGTAMPVAEQARRMPEDRQDYAVSRSIAARTWRFRHATYEPPRGSTAQVLRLRRARRRSARSVWRQRRQQGHAAPHRRRDRRSQFAATGQPGRCLGPAPFAGPLGSARIQAPASGKRREPTGNNGQSAEPSGPPHTGPQTDLRGGGAQEISADQRKRQTARYFSNCCRARTTRWIWFVPSVDLCDRRPAGSFRRQTARRVAEASTDPAQRNVLSTALFFRSALGHGPKLARGTIILGASAFVLSGGRKQRRVSRP